MTLQEWTRQIFRSSATREISPARLLHRRSLLGLGAAIGGGLAGALPWASRAQAPVCTLPARTPIEGPYYLADPQESFDTGEGLIVRGIVRDATTCLPLRGAIVVRWHANELGEYEELYRARMPVKADGSFTMSTIPPGKYSNLDRHIHFYAFAPNYAPVIAQLQWRDSQTIGPDERFDFSLTPG